MERVRDHKSELWFSWKTTEPPSVIRPYGWHLWRLRRFALNILLTVFRQTFCAFIAEMQTCLKSLCKQISVLLPRNVKRHGSFWRAQNPSYALVTLHLKRTRLPKASLHVVSVEQVFRSCILIKCFVSPPVQSVALFPPKKTDLFIYSLSSIWSCKLWPSQ